MSKQVERIVRAKTAVEAYAAVSGGGSFEEVLTDLLTDLMHYTDHLTDEDGEQLSFQNLLGAAANHHYHEVNEGDE